MLTECSILLINQLFIFFYSPFKCIFCIVLCFHCFWKAGKANAFSAMTTIIFPVGLSGFLLLHFLKNSHSFACCFSQRHIVELSSANQHLLKKWPAKLWLEQKAKVEHRGETANRGLNLLLSRDLQKMMRPIALECWTKHKALAMGMK